MNQAASGVHSSPFRGAEATSVGLRRFFIAYREYTRAMRLTTGCGEIANLPAPILVCALIDEAHLELICQDRLQRRPLADVTEAELMTNLKLEAGDSDERLNMELLVHAVEREA